jgi:hypothetical protein
MLRRIGRLMLRRIGRLMLTALDLWEGRGKRHDVFYSESVKVILQHQDRQRLTTIMVEGTIFAFGFSKKYNLSLLPTSGPVFNRCGAFDRFASVDAHLWDEEEWTGLMIQFDIQQN